MTEIVAEISGNHGGKIANAMQLIEEAAEAGADTVKFQCFDPERLAARRADNPEVLRLAGSRPLLDLYREIHTPQEWFPILADYADYMAIEWFSSVFDPLDVAFLEAMHCPRYKISAFEMLDWDIIKAVKGTGKPIVLSIRSTPGVTILHASHYNGALEPLGLSAHAAMVPNPAAPMVEYHLKLENVETPDSAFSLTPPQLRAMVGAIRRMARHD